MVLEQNSIPMDQNTDIGTAPSVPKENTVLPNYGPEIGTTPPMPKKGTMPSSTRSPKNKIKTSRSKLRKLSKKYKMLKRIVKKISEWLKEAYKAWKPKKETDIAET